MAASETPSGNARLSYWIDTTPRTDRPALAGDERVDVAVVGGGIAGITAAYLLAKAGKSVVVLERDRLALAETGHTTAHLQLVVDTRLKDLVPRFGLDGAKAAWDSQLEAVRLIESVAADERIACELTRLDAYLYTDVDRERDLLAEEMRLARRIGYEAAWAEPSEVPFPAKHALLFPDQGKFHVRKYLLGVVAAAERRGARFFEKTEVVAVDEGRHARVRTAGGATVTAEWVLHMTNAPFVGSEVIHTRLQPYRTYAIGARVPKGVFHDSLYWDTADPYHYTRVEPKGDHDLVILGGEDHRVGDRRATDQAWGRLLAYLAEATDQALPVYHWSGQVLETDDDLPYIGRVPGRPENEWMVTGDSGTGMTNNTLGAFMAVEHILGRGTPWDELYDPSRLLHGARPVGSWLAHNLHAAGSLAKGALQRSEVKDVAELAPGEGAILKRGLKPVAVARLEDGRLCAVSGLCTHVGCTVQWNHGETSWDCPCHGSRFAPTGEVLHGPAAKPLQPVDVGELLEDREKHDTRAS